MIVVNSSERQQTQFLKDVNVDDTLRLTMNHQPYAVVAAQGLSMGQVQQIKGCLIPPWAQTQQSSDNYHGGGEL